MELVVLVINSHLAILLDKIASISEQCLRSGTCRVSCDFAMEPLIAAPISPFDWPGIVHFSNRFSQI